MKNNSTRKLKLLRQQLHDKVINFFNTQSGDAAYNYKQVSAAIGATSPKDRALIAEILEQLSHDGFAMQVAATRPRAARWSPRACLCAAATARTA